MLRLTVGWKWAAGAAILFQPFAAYAQPAAVGMAEHHYNPSERTVVTSYTCAGAKRSITLQYGPALKGRVTQLYRNGRKARPYVKEKINKLLGDFEYLHSIFPQCGRIDDLISVAGTRRGVREGVLIRWSLTDARLEEVERRST